MANSKEKQYFLLSEIFYPDEISTGYVMTEIASAVAKKTPLKVICGPVHLESRVYQAKGKYLSPAIDILRIQIPNFNKNSIIGRIMRMVFLTGKIGLKLARSVRKGDRVLLVTNPPLLLLFVKVLKSIFKFELIIIVHDVFPENAVAAGILSNRSIFYKFLKRLFDKAYGCADKLIAVGADMKELLEQKCSCPIVVITNWADAHEIVPDPTLKLDLPLHSGVLDEKIVIQFAGNIGRVQGVKEFVSLFEKAKNPDLCLMIIGEGAMKAELKSYVRDKQITNVIILDSMPRAMQNTFLNSCDIGLVTLSRGMLGLGVPSKTYNILSSGKPILFIGDVRSEVARYIRSDELGWSYEWENEEQLIKFLSSLKKEDKPLIAEKGLRSRKLVEQRFTKKFILSEYQRELLFNEA